MDRNYMLNVRGVLLSLTGARWKEFKGLKDSTDVVWDIERMCL